MRAFIAFELPKEVKDYLFDISKDFNDLISAKWVAKKNLHLTLRFFKDISEKESERIIEKLKEIKLEPIKVKLDKFGVFPRVGKPRVMWVGLTNSGKIIELKDDIDGLIKDMFDREKNFAVHLTLGRVKRVKDKREFLDKIYDFKVKPIEFELDSLKFIESKLTKDGPKYIILESL